MISLFVALPLGMGFIYPLLGKLRFPPKLLGYLGAAVSGGLVALSVFKFGGQEVYNLAGWAPPIGINFVLDGFSGLLLIVVSTVTFLTFVYSAHYMSRFAQLGKFYGLFSLMIAGMYGVVLTGDMFNLYVFTEVAAVSSYALVGFNRGAEEIEAAFKYLIMGAVGSVFILFGVAMLYGVTGSLNMAEISVRLGELGSNSVVFLSSTFFILGFGLKAALTPFHSWLPDAHSSAPTPVSAVLSGLLIKIIGIYALGRILFSVVKMPEPSPQILIWLGVGSMFVGGITAIGQKDLKRLLAYSSVSQMGYISLALGMGGLFMAEGNSPAATLAISAGIFHLLNHAVYKALLFLTSGSIESQYNTRRMADLGGVARNMPVTGLSGVIGSLSISGVPPLNGFWSKLLIIAAAVIGGKYWLAGLTVMVSAITLAYYLKVQREVFLGKTEEFAKKIKEVPVGMYLPVAVLALMCVGLGLIYWPPFREVVLEPATTALRESAVYAKLVLGG